MQGIRLREHSVSRLGSLQSLAMQCSSSEKVRIGWNSCSCGPVDSRQYCLCYSSLSSNPLHAKWSSGKSIWQSKVLSLNPSYIFHSQQNVSIPYQMFSGLQTAAYQISVVTTVDCQMLIVSYHTKYATIRIWYVFLQVS